MEKIKSIIIDDEVLARENLAMLLEEYCQEIEIIGKANSADSAYTLINDLKPDLIFLDIRMPSGTEGFDLLSKFDDPKFLVIFVTAFKDYAIEAMNANAIHYILKPIAIADLENAVKKVVKLKNQINTSPEIQLAYLKSLKSVYQNISSRKNNKISISHVKGIKLIDTNKIVFIEAKSNSSNIHLSDSSTFFDTRTLAVYENLLDENVFFRIHRSYIINLDFLEEYRRDRGNYVILKGGQQLPIARLRLKDFLQFLRSYNQ